MKDDHKLDMTEADLNIPAKPPLLVIGRDPCHWRELEYAAQ